MNWDEIITTVSPYIVKIDTPAGSGTGFLCSYNENKSLGIVATALHVIDHADTWQQPIRVFNHDFTKQVLLKEGQRVIYRRPQTDSAAILLFPQELELPTELIPLRPIDLPLGIGAEIGWLGYPAISPGTLCFFSGNISARRGDVSAYFIDGVAINGVSGGPVLYSDHARGVQFVGVVSAYQANRLAGETLPGLLIAYDVSYFHDVTQQVRNFDEAIRKRAQLEAAPTPSPGPASAPQPAETAPGSTTTPPS